jgi:hypothetical protein
MKGHPPPPRVRGVSTFLFSTWYRESGPTPRVGRAPPTPPLPSLRRAPPTRASTTRDAPPLDAPSSLCAVFSSNAAPPPQPAFFRLHLQSCRPPLPHP